MKGPIGPFKPTNKPLVIHGLDVDDMRGDKMSKAMSYSNGIELLSGLGVLPEPGAAAAGAAREAPRKEVNRRPGRAGGAARSSRLVPSHAGLR